MAEGATTGFETTNGNSSQAVATPNGPPSDSSDVEERKIFIGGLKWETDEEHLKAYFSRFGEVVDCIVMMNTSTGQSRGFGFVTFQSKDSVDDVLASSPHSLDGRQIDPKRAVPRGRPQNPEQRVRKIFVGGLSPDINEDVLKHFFSQFGRVVDVLIQKDRETSRPRGFGFVTFETEAEAEEALTKQYHDIDGRQVEVKPAIPKGQGGRRMDRPPREQSGGYGNGYNPQAAAYGQFQPAGQGYYGGAPQAYYPGVYGAASGYPYAPQGYAAAYQTWGQPQVQGVPYGQPQSAPIPMQAPYGFMPYDGQGQNHDGTPPQHLPSSY
eukprot:m.51702 g.51702  ORF g.51702 m.51702 type:complete len:324 (-) comp13452_c0_seq1:266-1237(-)